MLEGNYRRKSFRIIPCNALFAKVAIVQVDSVKTNSRYAVVQIQNFSSKGLRFESHLNFPDNRNILLNFEISSYENFIITQGVITHKLDLKGKGYEYGICFNEVSESSNRSLTKLFSDLFVLRGQVQDC